MDCVFCKIIAGEIPAIRVYEDEATLAFMDINPVTDGHVLVVPKTHVTNLFDTGEPELLASARTARRVAGAMRTALGLDSLNLVQANGPHAAQSVPHLHFHLIPRRENDGAPLDWPLQPGDQETISRLAERIAGALG